jgi:deoxyribodipyrimidine photo-lyase
VPIIRTNPYGQQVPAMTPIHPARVVDLNTQPQARGKYVLYWMQASQRALCNHALEYAARAANELHKPLVVCFGLMDNYPQANERSYAFMLQGLACTKKQLAQRGIGFTVRLAEQPWHVALELALDAAMVVTDRGYLRHQKQWRAELAQRCPVRLVQVESDVVVPVNVASSKEEFAARTIRPKLHRHLAEHLVEVEPVKVSRDALGVKLPGLDLSDVDALLAPLRIDRSVKKVTTFTGGTDQAMKLLEEFLSRKINDYAELRSEPSLDYVSHQSPYLHFGQISPITLALSAKRRTGVKPEALDVFLEELIIRRELSMNFCEFSDNYDTFDCLPNWAIKELTAHEKDPRKPSYTREQLEAATTHDPYWNAAQLEMVRTGKMHNYMRMYWGKKIIEWTPSPRDAFDIALDLNNKYQLDGRDPNSFAGVAWVFGKHDRPWTPRPIFGSVRYMNDKGLERKSDIKAYVRKIDAIAGDSVTLF